MTRPALSKRRTGVSANLEETSAVGGVQLYGNNADILSNLRWHLVLPTASDHNLDLTPKPSYASRISKSNSYQSIAPVAQLDRAPDS